MKRREFISLLGGAAASWPLGVSAQPADRVRRIAVLIATYAQTDREGQARVAAFLDTLQRLGWADGRNLRMEYRWGGGDVEQIKGAASELVRSTPDLIVVASNPALAELQRLTSTIPIVFAQVSDPDGSGFVASLARPGANITGFQNFETAIGGKCLGVLKEAAPDMRRAAVLFGSDNVANVAFLHAAEAVAPSLAVQVTAIDLVGGIEIERAIAMFASQPDGGLIVVPNVYNTANRGSIFLLAARHRLPAVYPFRFFAAEGGLMFLRARPDRAMAWSGNLRRSHPARREARPIAGSSADKVRAGGQPQDREGAWVEHPACISAARRRGDRMKRRAFIAMLGM